MEFIVTVIFAVVVWIVYAAVREGSDGVNTVFNAECENLCYACAHAQIARGVRTNRETIECTYGGSARAIGFAVADCTMYCPRSADSDLVRVIGFAATLGAIDYADVTARTDN